MGGETLGQTNRGTGSGACAALGSHELSVTQAALAAVSGADSIVVTATNPIINPSTGERAIEAKCPNGTMTVTLSLTGTTPA